MEFLEDVKAYYRNTLEKHGATNKGVDWSSQESQVLRFQQLTKLLPQDAFFTLADIGCGYGALVEYLSTHYSSYEYTGFDLLEEMIAIAQETYGSSSPHVSFLQQTKPDKCYDYVIASGIFNLMLETNRELWQHYFYDTLHTFHEHCNRGFSFNCLTSFSDPEYMRADLFYVNPMEVFSYCKNNFSRNVALLHDYNLYEFTVIVRK